MTNTFLSGHNRMADYFPNVRRESRTERKQWRFVPSISGAFDELVERRKALWKLKDDAEGSELSEVDVANSAIAKEAKSLPVLEEVLVGEWANFPIERIIALYNPGDLISPQKGDYFLRVPRGTAMTGDYIQEGDLIHFRPQSFCDDDEVAAVRVDTAAGKKVFLKRIKFVENSKKVRLIPIRSGEKEIVVDADKEPFEILAVKKGLIRAN